MKNPASNPESDATIDLSSVSTSPRTLELPDQSITVDEEFAEIWRTAEVIGALSADDYRWSFTSVLLALLYSGGEISQWFLGYAQAAQVHLVEIGSARGFSASDLPRMRAEFARGGNFLRKTPFTSSMLNLFAGATELYRSMPGGPMGARHLLGAYIYRLPSGHLDQIHGWGFVPKDWSEKFLQYAGSRYPQETFWATSHQQQFGGYIQETPPPGPSGPRTTFRVTAPDGAAEFPISVSMRNLLNFADSSKTGARLTSEVLLFAALEMDATDPGDPALGLLSNSVKASASGLHQYREIESNYIHSEGTSAKLAPEPVPCTTNVKSILSEAQRIACDVGPATESVPVPIELRHLVAALLTVRTVATSIMPRIGLDVGTLRSQFLGILGQYSGISDDLNRWSRILAGGHSDASFVPLRADFTADNIPRDPAANDQLEFKRDVRAFASVIASRELSPPMSIGVFGDWGSGKSFFMRQLEQKIKTLAGTDSAYCSNVVTVWFNAWHYVDQNLWATLVTEIFDKLFAYIRKDGQEDAETRLKTIVAELSKEQGLHREAKAELDKAVADRETAEGELKNLRQERTKKENELSVQLNDVADLALGSPDVKKNLVEVQRDLGIPALDSSYEQFETEVKRMRSLGVRALAILAAVFQEPGRVRRAGLLFVFGLPFVSAYLIGKFMTSGALQRPAQLIAGGVTLLVTATGWLTWAYKVGSAVISKAETTLAQLKKIRERREAEAESGNRGEIEVLREREDAARQKIKGAEAKIQELKAEQEELLPGRRLQRFIEQRFEAGEYRQHLGLVSLIRRDFETLSRLLRDSQDMPVDRIVLFIDDLDRCPPERVCEVLEAIHLILAFELFVVVVGVDVRWVAKSLKKRYSGLLTGGVSSTETNRDDVASPEDYLEKIFQVPFWINPLQAGGSRALVASMLAKYPTKPTPDPIRSVAAPPAISTPSGASPGAALPGDAPAAAPLPLQPIPQSLAPNIEAPETPTPRSVAPPASDEDGKSAPITLNESEQKFILELSQFGGTSPRRLKRFINLYRVIKSTLSASEVEDFLGRSGDDGDYRLVLVLLAVLTGSPVVGGEILRKVQQNGQGLQSVLKELNQGSRDDYRSCLGAFGQLHSKYDDSNASVALARWASVVSRYSFRP